MRKCLSRNLLLLSTFGFTLCAHAEPVTYLIDDHHTFPSFETDHLGGLSMWRGKFKETSGRIILDREKKSGSVQISVNLASIDFGHEDLNAHARSADILDVRKYPVARYVGEFSRFIGDVPTEVNGKLTLHGVSQPLALTLLSFKCVPNHPILKKEVCGADVYAVLNRKYFNIDYGLDKGFFPEVRLSIQVEAIRQPAPAPLNQRPARENQE